MQLSNQVIEIGERMLEEREARQAAINAELRAAQARRVAEYNAQLRRTAGVVFVVVETATGRVVGDGKPLPYGFAKRVRDTRDAFAEGAFLVKRVN